MIGRMKTWWAGHSVAERRILAGLGAAVCVVLLWLGVWRPVNVGIEAGWARQGTALDRYGSVRAKVTALKAMPAPSGQAAVPIEQLVGQSAAEAGFTLERSGAQGAGRMSIVIASARMEPLLAWLSRLEESGVHVQTIGITPGATQGAVAVQAVLEESRP